jgi:hypothetical protein
MPKGPVEVVQSSKALWIYPAARRAVTTSLKAKL